MAFFLEKNVLSEPDPDLCVSADTESTVIVPFCPFI